MRDTLETVDMVLIEMMDMLEIESNMMNTEWMDGHCIYEHGMNGCCWR